jgi:hypothetical protein
MHTDKHGLRKALFVHHPGEPLGFCKGWVSVSIGVHPWLMMASSNSNGGI